MVISQPDKGKQVKLTAQIHKIKNKQKRKVCMYAHYTIRHTGTITNTNTGQTHTPPPGSLSGKQTPGSSPGR